MESAESATRPVTGKLSDSLPDACKHMHQISQVAPQGRDQVITPKTFTQLKSHCPPLAIMICQLVLYWLIAIVFCVSDKCASVKQVAGHSTETQSCLRTATSRLARSDKGTLIIG